MKQRKIRTAKCLTSRWVQCNAMLRNKLSDRENCLRILKSSKSGNAEDDFRIAPEAVSRLEVRLDTCVDQWHGSTSTNQRGPCTDTGQREGHRPDRPQRSTLRGWRAWLPLGRNRPRLNPPHLPYHTTNVTLCANKERETVLYVLTIAVFI